MKGARASAVLSDALSLVLDPWPSARVVGRWSEAQRKAAWDWVGREVLHANDHDDVERIPPPDHLLRWTLDTHRKAASL